MHKGNKKNNSPFLSYNENGESNRGKNKRHIDNEYMYLSNFSTRKNRDVIEFPFVKL